jgi:exosortase
MLLGLVWLDVFRQLSYEWITNEQYGYGWFVPFFGLALMLRRWTNRPTAQPQALSLWSGALLLAIALSFLPLRVVHEVNPDWPLISWAMTSGLVAVSLYTVYLAGGPPWLKHFTFPICFMLVSIRWPFRLEQALIQGLMQIVTSITVEALGWLNVPALQYGNTIELSTGRVGIADACSGIRSFQSTVMGGLFLGELFHLKWRRRCVLVLVGLGFAFCLNIVRTLFLAWQAASVGISAIHKWHDSAGLAIFVVTFLLLWALAARLRPLAATPERRSEPVLPVELPRPFLYALAAWAIIVLVGNELWFGLRESRTSTATEWSPILPSDIASFREVELSDREKSLLQHDISRTGTWQESAGKHWTLYYLQWLPGSTLSRIKARAHRPEICLRAAGLNLENGLGSTVFDVKGLRIPFQRYAFETEDGKAFVFFCLWEDGAENLPRTETMTHGDRFRAALNAQRRVGQRSLEIILRGYSDLKDAEQAVRSRLPDLIQIQGGQPAATVPATVEHIVRFSASGASASSLTARLHLGGRFTSVWTPPSSLP